MYVEILLYHGACQLCNRTRLRGCTGRNITLTWYHIYAKLTKLDEARKQHINGTLGASTCLLSGLYPIFGLHSQLHTQIYKTNTHNRCIFCPVE